MKLRIMNEEGITSPRTRPGHALRVLAVGDCNTCGIEVPPVGNTILDKFCRCLELAGYPTDSQNLGYGMATSREGIILMEECAKPADVLLINFGLVDSWITSIPKVYIPYFPENRIKKLARKALKYTKRQLRSSLIRRIVPIGEVVPIAEYRRNIERIIKIARHLNPAVWVVLWGSPPVQNDDRRNEELLLYNAELHDIANCLGASYFPTKPIVDCLNIEEAFLDNVHLNEVATAGIATGLAHTYLSQLQQTAA
jgi:lysophospholipase L1-like esterase